MKKIFLGFAIALSLLTQSGAVVAVGPTTEDVFKEGGFFFTKDGDGKTQLKDYAPFTTPKGWKAEDGTDATKGWRNVVDTADDYLKRVIVALAILWTAWSGLSLILSSGEEEEFTKRRRHIYGMTVGFMLMLLAPLIVDDVFFGKEGEVLRDAPAMEENGEVTESAAETVTTFAQEGVKQLQGIFKYFTSFAVIAGVAFLIFSAVKMMLAGGEDEGEITALKKRLVYTLLGMAILVSAEKIVEIFTDNKKLMVPDERKLIYLVTDWGNFILGFIGVLAVFALVWGGIRLISNLGQDETAVEEAKKIVIAAVIGLIVAFSAWTLMYAFVVPA